MVEESNMNPNKPKVSILPTITKRFYCLFSRLKAKSYHLQSKTTRPKAVYLWTEADVQKWLRRHCSDYYNLYWERFHEVTLTLYW